MISAVLLTGVTLHDRHHRPALVLDQIRMSLSAVLGVRCPLGKIALDRPSLVLGATVRERCFWLTCPLTGEAMADSVTGCCVSIGSRLPKGGLLDRRTTTVAIAADRTGQSADSQCVPANHASS